MRALVVLLCTLASSPLPASSAATGQVVPDDLITATQCFEFHSNAWLNLHHYLFNLAKDYGDAELSAYLPTQGLSPDETEIFGQAAAHYREHLADKSLLFDRRLSILKRRLITFEADESPDLGEETELAKLLKAVNPVYLKHFWPAQHASNQRILAENLGLVTRLESRIAERISELAQSNWPDHKIRIDLSYRANWAGAYTTVNPVVHAVIQSHGWEARYDWLEILFHEPTHALILPDQLMVAETIEREAARLGIKARRSLWHGILFYIAGTAVQEALAEEGIEYQLFMFRNEVFSRYHAVLLRHMPAYVRGDATLGEAIRAMMSDPEQS